MREYFKLLFKTAIFYADKYCLLCPKFEILIIHKSSGYLLINARSKLESLFKATVKFKSFGLVYFF